MLFGAWEALLDVQLKHYHVDRVDERWLLIIM